MAKWRILILGVGLGLMSWCVTACREEPKGPPSKEVDEARAHVQAMKAEIDAKAAEAAGSARPVGGRAPTTAPALPRVLPPPASSAESPAP